MKLTHKCFIWVVACMGTMHITGYRSDAITVLMGNGRKIELPIVLLSSSMNTMDYSGMSGSSLEILKADHKLLAKTIVQQVVLPNNPLQDSP